MTGGRLPHWPIRSGRVGEGEAEPPEVVNEATPELMAPVLELVELLNDEKWDQVMEPMLPGGGATYSRFPNTLLAMLWPEFYKMMEMMEMLERAPGHI